MLWDALGLEMVIVYFRQRFVLWGALSRGADAERTDSYTLFGLHAKISIKINKSD